MYRKREFGVKLAEVIHFFKINGFKETQFIRRSQVKESTDYSILPFNNILTNENRTELYILEERVNGVFNKNEIENFEKKIAAFIPFLSNHDPIKYNINLILLCPLHLEKKEDWRKTEIANVIGFERSKYTCRKIFLDTANKHFEDELSLIPSIPLHVHLKFSESDQHDLTLKAKEILSTHLYEELVKEKEDIFIGKILTLLRTEKYET